MSKIKIENLLGLDHEKVKLRFEGDLSFVNTLGLRLESGEIIPVAAYRSQNPNREKGHKTLMLLAFDGENRLMVLGREPGDSDLVAEFEGVECLKCETAIYSTHRHHHVACDCENGVFIDGGFDYCRVGAQEMWRTEKVKINALTDDVQKAE